jgi:hypothetical protein
VAQDFGADRAAAAIRESRLPGGEDPHRPGPTPAGGVPVQEDVTHCDLAERADDFLRELTAGPIDAPEGSVGQEAVELLTDWGRTYRVRRRVLDVQLARLSFRLGGRDLAARDAAARTVTLTSRLERNELAW